MPTLYIGGQKVTPSLGENYTWWGGKNATFLYESSIQKTFNDTNWSTKTPTTASQSLLYNPTTYTTSANANVIYDRWGDGYNFGTTLNFGEHDYFVLIDAKINIGYTETESTMGSPHTVMAVASMVAPLFQLPYYENNAANTLIYPQDGQQGHFNVIGANNYRIQYRLANNRLAAITNGYGIYLTTVTPTIPTTTSAGLTNAFINFRMPTIYFRGHNSYFPVDNFSKIDASNTIIIVRQRLYQTDKRNYCEIQGNRFGYIFEHNNFPTEII